MKLGASASDRAQPLVLHVATGAHFAPSQKSVLEHFVMFGDGKGSQFMHLLRNALHSPSQMSPPEPQITIYSPLQPLYSA
jgi:hypothetical protein